MKLYFSLHLVKLVKIGFSNLVASRHMISEKLLSPLRLR